MIRLTKKPPKQSIKAYLVNENTNKYLVSFIQVYHKMQKSYFVDTLRNCLRILNISLCNIKFDNYRSLLLDPASKEEKIALAEALSEVAGQQDNYISGSVNKSV